MPGCSEMCSCWVHSHVGPSPSVVHVPPSLSSSPVAHQSPGNRIKYRPTLSKLSILIIQSLSFFSSSTISLSFATGFYSFSIFSLALLPLANSPWWWTVGILDEEMENIPQTAQAVVVKGDFHNESLDDPGKESAGSLCVCEHRVPEAPSVYSFSLRHHFFREPPLLCLRPKHQENNYLAL